MKKKIEGLVTALVTPLNADGSLDCQKMKNLIEFQISNQVDALLFLGGTGEYVALQRKVREEIVDFAVKTVAGRVPVIIGILEPGIGESISFGQTCKSLGADAVLVITPYYFHSTQEGIYRFYKTFCSSVDLLF